MKEIVNKYENTPKLIYHIIFVDIGKPCRIASKNLYLKKRFYVHNPSGEFYHNQWKKK